MMPPTPRRWTRWTLPAALLMLGTLTLAPGCGATQGARGDAQDVLTNTLLPVSQENALGDQMEAEIAQQMTVLDNAKIQRYVDGIGQRLASAADVPEGIELAFSVIDDDSQINAFAIPGGHIYVYTGLLKSADSEAELASVLGHEIAHVTQRHVADQIVTQFGLQTLASIALGRDPGMLSQLVAQVAGTGVLLKHSRDAEREADRYGIRYTINAGYSPRGYISFFSKLAALQGGARTPDFLQTHPDPDDRVENARRIIQGYDQTPQMTNEARYQEITTEL